MANNQPATGNLYITIEYAKDLKDKDLFGKVCRSWLAGVGVHVRQHQLQIVSEGLLLVAGSPGSLICCYRQRGVGPQERIT
jgi:hypothetical protein